MSTFRQVLIKALEGVVIAHSGNSRVLPSLDGNTKHKIKETARKRRLVQAGIDQKMYDLIDPTGSVQGIDQGVGVISSEDSGALQAKTLPVQHAGAAVEYREADAYQELQVVVYR